jgi:hypothetical protein
MILAHEFVRSHIARDSDFTTCALECEATSNGRQHAVVAQFAASEPMEFARAAELISPWVDGVDLNCGCPQSWAIKEAIGCSLMQDPEKVARMVQAAKRRLGPGKTVSVKIRILRDPALDKHRRGCRRRLHDHPWPHQIPTFKHTTRLRSYPDPRRRCQGPHTRKRRRIQTIRHTEDHFLDGHRRYHVSAGHPRESSCLRWSYKHTSAMRAEVCRICYQVPVWKA